MNKYLKSVGKGFIWGIMHPFTNDLPNRNDDDQNIGEAVLDGLGTGLSQGIIQGCIGIGITIGILAGIGYVNEKFNETPKIKMVIEK